MSTDPIAVRNISASVREVADSWMRERARLMAELEASLHSSQKALLALDLSGMVRETEEQSGLIRRFEKLFREGMMQAAERRDETDETNETNEQPAAHLCSTTLQEVRHNAKRIGEAARLQAVLLTKAQGKLHVLANMLAGSAVTYGPFQGRGEAQGEFPFRSR